MPRRDIRRFINFFGFLPNAEVIKFYHAPKLKPRARLHVCMRLAASSAGEAGGRSCASRWLSREVTYLVIFSPHLRRRSVNLNLKNNYPKTGFQIFS